MLGGLTLTTHGAFGRSTLREPPVHHQSPGREFKSTQNSSGKKMLEGGLQCVPSGKIERKISRLDSSKKKKTETVSRSTFLDKGGEEKNKTKGGTRAYFTCGKLAKEAVHVLGPRMEVIEKR